MKLSLITPTEAREEHLLLLYKLIQEQTFKGEWEWLIYDTHYKSSPFFASLEDPRVHYHFSPDVLTIGDKRNFLCERAKGEGILHLDDDDYYAPTYLEKMAKELEEVSFFSFHSWYCFDLFSRTLYYCSCDKSTPTHFVHNPIEYTQMDELEVKSFDEKAFFFEKIKYGYGFSYAYHKKVWEKCPFNAENFGEDLTFYTKLKGQNFSHKLLADTDGEVLHMLHDKNTSRAFPQYRLPPFLLPKLFPSFQPYLNKFPT